MESEEDKQKAPSFEDVLEKLGPTGKFQMIQIAFCYISLLLACAIAMSFIFLGHQPHHVCNTVNETSLLSSYGLQNDSTAQIVYRSCDIQISTNQSGKISEVDTMSCPKGRNFGDAKHTTFLSEWDLVCESSGVAELSQTLLTVGQVIGGFIGSSISDRYGRKPILIASSFFACLAEFSIAGAPNIFVIYGLKLLSGIFYQSLMCSYFVYAMELLPPRHREANGLTMGMSWCVWALLVGGTAFLLQDHSWKYFQVAIGVSGLCCLVYPFVLYESPRWLAANDKIEEALRVLKKASKTNGKDFQPVKETFNAYVAHAFPYSKCNALPMIEGKAKSDNIGSVQENEDNQKRYNMLSLIRVKSLRKRTLLAWFIYTTNLLTYYGLYMTSSKVAGNRFLNFVFMTLVEVPSAICTAFMMKKMGRRIVLAIFLGLAAITLMTSSLIATFADTLDGSATAVTVLFILGKLFITSSFNVIYQMVPELYPTNLRSSATGFCGGLGRVGSMIAPFLRPIYNVAKWGPALIFAVMCLISVVLAFFLRETKDENLPDTFVERSDRTKKNTFYCR